MATLPFVEQAKTFYNKLTTVQRVTIGIAIVSAITGLSLLIASTTRTQMGVLFSELEQKDAAVMVEKLKEQGVEYELSANGATISVPTDKIYEMRLSLAKEGIPANSTVGYEIFDKTNLGMSDFVQKLNYKRAIEGEMQKTIGSFDEVQKVRVMIVVPEKTLFEKDQKKPTAAIYLHLKGGRSISKLNVEGIQNLVASSVEGMQTADVSVVDQRGRILSEVRKDANSVAGLSSTQYEQQQKVDEYLIGKVQSLLDGVLGPGNAAVRVNTELDFTQMERTKENYDPDGQVVLSEERINEARKSQDSLDYPAVNSESNVGKIRTNYQNSKTVEKMVGGVGTLKRLSVSVLVNGATKVVEEGGTPKIQYTPRTDDEMQKLTQIVRNAVGFDPTRNDQVSVINMPFDMTAQEEELRNRSWDLPMTTQEIIEKVMLALALLIAIWMIRKLFASPHIRRKIEEIISPPQPVLETPYQLAAAHGMMIGPNGQLLPASQKAPAGLLEETTGSNRDELLARARARLDGSSESDMTEEQLMVEEMKHRIQELFQNNNESAVKLLKLMMSKSK